MQITSGDMPMLSDLQLVYMVPRNSTQLLKINTTKFQVEREPVYQKRIIFIYNNDIASARVELWSSSTNAKYAESSSTNYILCKKLKKNGNSNSLK